MSSARMMIVLLLGVLATYAVDAVQVAPAIAADVVLPVITAHYNGAVLVTGSDNSVTLPATITFKANMPVTVYYTTNGTDPTTATPSSIKIEAADSMASGPTLINTNAILVTLGADHEGLLSNVTSYTFFTP